MWVLGLVILKSRYRWWGYWLQVWYSSRDNIRGGSSGSHPKWLKEVEDIPIDCLWILWHFHLLAVFHDNYWRETALLERRCEKCACDRFFIYLLSVAGRRSVRNHEHRAMSEPCDSFWTSFILVQLPIPIIYFVPLHWLHSSSRLLRSRFCENLGVP